MSLFKYPMSAASKQTNPETTIAVSIAPFWKRLAAWIYDLLGATAIFILAFVIGYLVIYFVTMPWLDNGSELSALLTSNPLWSVYLAICVQYYYVWCWVKGGQTVGMKTWRLKVCHPNGQLLSWKEAYLRSFLSLAGVANCWCLLDKDKRGWHDIAVNSSVVLLPKGYGRPDKPLI